MLLVGGNIWIIPVLCNHNHNSYSLSWCQIQVWKWKWKSASRAKSTLVSLFDTGLTPFAHNTRWRNSKNSDNCDLLKVSDFWLALLSMEKIYFKWYSPVQRRSHGNIYVEKFANIGTSELCWNISGLFLDDRDIYGFLLINSIIVHMTRHFL